MIRPLRKLLRTTWRRLIRNQNPCREADLGRGRAPPSADSVIGHSKHFDSDACQNRIPLYIYSYIQVLVSQNALILTPVTQNTLILTLITQRLGATKPPAAVRRSTPDFLRHSQTVRARSAALRALGVPHSRSGLSGVFVRTRRPDGSNTALSGLSWRRLFGPLFNITKRY